MTRRWSIRRTDWYLSSWLLMPVQIADAALVALMGWDDKRGIDSSGYILLPAPLWPDSLPLDPRHIKGSAKLIGC